MVDNLVIAIKVKIYIPLEPIIALNGIYSIAIHVHVQNGLYF